MNKLISRWPDLVAGIGIAILLFSIPILYQSCSPLSLADKEFKYREALETMLVHDEAGAETVTRMLTVRHDGPNHLVVGIGHDVLPDDHLYIGDKISLDRAVLLFKSDISKAIAIARKVVHDFDTQPDNVQIILCSLAFQLGEKGLRSFKKMLAAIEERDYLKAASELKDSKLAREQTSSRAHREAMKLLRAD